MQNYVVREDAYGIDTMNDRRMSSQAVFEIHSSRKQRRRGGEGRKKEMSTYSLTRTRVEETSTKARYITEWKQIANQEESRSCV